MAAPRSLLLGASRAPTRALGGSAATIASPIREASAPTENLLDVAELKGKVCPRSRADAVYLRIDGREEVFLPAFSTAHLLRDALRRARAPYSSIIRIDHEHAFLETVPREIAGRQVKVIVDLLWLPSGGVRYTEVKWT